MNQESNFEHQLNFILKELSLYHRDKEILYKNYVQERLTKHLKVYYNDMYNTYLYLLYKNEQNLLKRYKKVMK